MNKGQFKYYFFMGMQHMIMPIFLSLIFVLSLGTVSNVLGMAPSDQLSKHTSLETSLADSGWVCSMGRIPVQSAVLNNLCDHSCIPSSPARCNCSCVSIKPNQVVELVTAISQEDEEEKRNETIQQIKCNLLVLKKQVGKTKAIKIAIDQVKQWLDSSEEDDTASSGSSPSGIDSDELLEDLKKKKE